MPADIAIEAEGLRKSYGKVVALDGVDLRVPASLSDWRAGRVPPKLSDEGP
jgi:hypothetical protein